jgi:serine protease Do
VAAVQKTRASVVKISFARQGGKDVIGSGVIIDPRGLIVTNAHVVSNNSRVHVRLNDGTNLTGAVLFSEPRWDLAIVQVDAGRPLPALALANVDDLMVGETVIALGHPYGYTDTVSTGIVSALGREITMPNGHTITGLIQADASINPGNSGGALVNIDGELIGINVALRDGAQGIAFALNADLVRGVVAQRLAALGINGIERVQTVSTGSASAASTN